jgi:protein-S-isoprenylcysteine O-methyltransferase Ste14
MARHDHEHLAGEMPRSHTYQETLFVLFIAVWFLDSFVFKLTTPLLDIVPIWISIVSALIIMIGALQLMNSSHKTLFESGEAGLVTTGVFSRVRHPMYLATFLVYLALAIGTKSSLSISLWVVIFLAYDMMASYEERLLESKFGVEYANYRAKVRKWVPIRK